MDNFDYQSPSAYLILRHKLDFKESNIVIDCWIKENPQESRRTLSELLRLEKVIFKNGRLHNLPRLTKQEAELLIQEIQNSTAVEVKDRQYRLKQYPQCFIGSELVDWLQTQKDLLTPEAISLGQSLVEYGLIQHVTNDHEFKDDFLFYRFQN